MITTLLALATAATVAITDTGSLIEPATDETFPESVVVTVDGKPTTMAATGLGLRDATFMNIDVFTMASYIDAEAALPGDDRDDVYEALIDLDVAKHFYIRFRRDVPQDKMSEEFEKSIRKNVDIEDPAFWSTVDDFLALFDQDAKKGSVYRFTVLPGGTFVATFGDEERARFEEPRLARAYWSLYFGRKPQSKDLRKDLVRFVVD